MALCVPNQTGMFHLIPIQSTFAQESEKNQPFKWRILGEGRPPLGPNSFVFMQFSAKVLRNNRLAHLSEFGATAFIHRIKASHSCPWSRFKNGANQVLFFL